MPTKACPHGHLARSCELCERDVEIAELRAELDEALPVKAAHVEEIAELRAQLAEAEKRNRVVEAINAELVSDVEALAAVLEPEEAPAPHPGFKD